jgi:lysophospholipase L1-like esterase
VPIPNLASASFAAQAEPDSIDFDILTGYSAGVRMGCVCTPGNSGVNLSVAVAGGTIYAGTKTPVTVAAATVTPGAASGSNPRFDLIVASNAGVLSVVAGTAAAAPVFPTVPALSVVLAAVWIPTSATSITAANITDKRRMVDYDPPGPGVAGTRGGEMRTWRAAWANRLVAPCNIVVVGDSVSVGFYAVTAATRWIDIMTQRLCQAAGQPSPLGYVPLSTTSHSGYTGRLWTTAGTVTDRNDTGLAYSNSTLAVGASATFTTTCDRIWVYYPTFPASIGSFTVTVDGTLLTTINQLTGAAVVGGRKYDTGALTAGSHLLSIAQSGATSAVIEGAMFFDGNGGTSGTNGAGVRVYAGGHFGKTANYFALPNAGGNLSWWTDGFDSINPHVVLVFLGINDQASRTAAQYGADLVTIVNRFTTVAATNSVHPPSVVFMNPYGVGVTSDLTLPFTAAAKDAAAQTGAAWVNLYDLMGFVGTAAADDAPVGYSFMSAIDGPTAKVHPTDKGHALIGGIVADFLLGAAGASNRVALTTFTAVTGTYSVLAADDFITADATAAAFTVTLPTAVGCKGRRISVKRLNLGVNLVTVAPTGTQTIDGSTNYVLTTQNEVVAVVSDGVNWQVF